MRKLFLLWILAMMTTLSFASDIVQENKKSFVPVQLLEKYVNYFNSQDNELYPQRFPNDSALSFMKQNIPLFECPDKQLELTYYFRWWTYRKHIKSIPGGHIITEFLPAVYWAGKHNSISCAAALHFYEGRWLRNPQYLYDYARFWMEGEGNPRLYSFWIADALMHHLNIHPDTRLMKELYPYLKANYAAWEKEKRDSTHLFWQRDDRDGMEFSVSGKMAPREEGYRATINSYMYGELVALSQMARQLQEDEDTQLFERKAKELKRMIDKRLWSNQSHFFMVIPRNGKGKFSPVRELHGYTPWLFNIPSSSRSVAWLQLMNKDGFFAPYGPTTVEQRSPYFTLDYKGHECQWNGPSWPFSTSITLTAMANLLNDYQQDYITAKDYMTLLKQYSMSHIRINENQTPVPWIDENLDPYSGDWLSRTRLATWKNGTWDKGKGGLERGKDYNHSTFCDLIISGLMGFRPQPDGNLLIRPLLPKGYWQYFCLQDVAYQNRLITIVYDADGNHYHIGKGYKIFVDGRCVHQFDTIMEYKIVL